MTAFKETLRTINNRSGRTLAVDDDDFIDTSDLDVSLGDPIGFSNQTSVTVRVAAHVWYQKDIDIIDFLDRVRKALLDKKCEAYWSCAQRNDKCTTGIFSFRISPDAVDDITPTDARKAVTTLCKTAGHPITSAYAIDFQRARDNDKPLQVTVKFVHVASVFLFPSTVKPADLQLGNYTITYGPCLSVIPPTYPTTMASPHKAEVPEHALRSELKRWIKRYNKKNDTTDGLRDQGYMAHGRYFVVTPTSMALAEYSASQECEFGYPYELVYDLNDRSLVPAAAVAERDRNNQQRLTNEATSALNALTTRIVAAEKAQADNAQTMVVVQHTLKTMAQDNRKNHRALFDYQQHRDSLRDEQNSIRFQLADVKGDIRSCDSQIHPLRVQLIEYSVNDDPQAQAKATQYQSLQRLWKTKGPLSRKSVTVSNVNS